jgi:hypothetical protein
MTAAHGSVAAPPHLLDQTDFNQGWRSSVEAIPQIIDVAGGGDRRATPGGVNRRGPVGPWPLPRALVLYARLLSIF